MSEIKNKELTLEESDDGISEEAGASEAVQCEVIEETSGSDPEKKNDESSSDKAGEALAIAGEVAEKTAVIVSEGVADAVSTVGNAVTGIDNTTKKRFIIAGALVVLALLSIFVCGNIASNPNTYAGITKTLDEKKANVMALSATTTAAAGVAAILPISGSEAITAKLLELDSYLLIILAVIYLEKILASTLGWCAFTFLLPIAFALFAFAIFQQQGSLIRANLYKLGTKLTAFSLALILVIPVSVGITDKIDDSYEATLKDSTVKVEESTQDMQETEKQIAEIKEKAAEAKKEAPQQQQQQNNDSQPSVAEGDWLGGLINSVGGAVGYVQKGATDVLNNAQKAASDMVTSVQATATEILEKAKKTVNDLGVTINRLLDTLAVMIVTSCIIPIAVLAIFLYLIKLIGGVDFGGASGVMNRGKEASQKVFNAMNKGKKELEA